jgi:hypothetical protein
MAGFPEESKPLASGVVVDDEEVVVEREWQHCSSIAQLMADG